VVFVQKQNDYLTGGRLRRYVASIREVNGVDGRVLSSEIFAAGHDGVAVAAAPIASLDELVAVGYQPSYALGGAR
jgi:pilus assembly protein CpaF